MRIELTIKADYLPEWSVWHGVRELIQNGKDAETEFHAPMKVEIYNNTLRIENDGCSIPHEALLFGHTTKSERSDTIGKFGEGLKLGILALVRAGRPVKIRSGSEVWIPTIVHSEKFDADVLAFDIATGREPKNRVRVEVGGVTEAEWEELRNKFLFLADRAEAEKLVSTQYGTLLLEAKHQGKVFVKGIYVQSSPTLMYGYDFSDVQVDRDRKMVNSWDLQYRTNKIWTDAVSRRPDLFDPFMAMVREDHEDVKGINDYGTAYIANDLLKKVAKDFHDKFGEDAVPVGNLSESSDIEHLGKRGVVVNKVLASLLTPTVGTVEKVKANLATEIITRYSYGDLTEEERKTIDGSLLLLKESGVCSDPVIDVVDFRSKTLLGQFQGGKSSISRSILNDKNQTLLVLVHELAHQAGGDGEKSHVATIEDYWMRIVAYLRKVIE